MLLGIFACVPLPGDEMNHTGSRGTIAHPLFTWVSYASAGPDE
jgi:hypothetical protein